MVTGTDGARLATWSLGSEHDPGVVLIAGAGADHRGWRRVVPELCASAEERALWAAHGRSLTAGLRLAVFDQRGTGESRAVAPARTADATGSDAVAVGRAILGDHFAVVGASMGGMAALHAALLYPTTVTALALVATTAGGIGLTWPTEAFLAGVTASADASDKTKVRAGLAVSVSEGFRTEHPRLFEAMVAEAAAEPSSEEAVAAQANVFTTHDVVARLGAIAVPTLVLCGTEDRAHPLPNSQFLATRIPGARLVVLEGVGHIIGVEAPEQLIDLLTAFLAAPNRRLQPSRRRGEHRGRQT